MCDVPTRSRYQPHYLERVWYAQVKGMASWQCCSIGKAKLSRRRAGREVGALLCGARQGERMLSVLGKATPCPWLRERAEEQPLLVPEPPNPAPALLVPTFPSQQRFPRSAQPPLASLPCILGSGKEGTSSLGLWLPFFGWEGAPGSVRGSGDVPAHGG